MSNIPPTTAKLMPRLHVGCGFNTPNGWINMDSSWGARLAKHPQLHRAARTLRLAPEKQFEYQWCTNILLHDLRKPLPFPSASVSAIYGSHVLEHLYLVEARRLLQECFRVLSTGGILRLVVPDLKSI